MSTNIYENDEIQITQYYAGSQTIGSGYQIIDKRTGQIINLTASKYLKGSRK
jgi:hypothetical protein